jgi:hypothetical protein
MKLSSLLALDADHRAIGNSLVGLSIQRHPNGKAAGRIVSNDLNATNGLTARPLSNCVHAFFSERRVGQPDCLRFSHAAQGPGPCMTYQENDRRSLDRCDGRVSRESALGTAGLHTGQSNAAFRTCRFWATRLRLPLRDVNSGQYVFDFSCVVFWPVLQPNDHLTLSGLWCVCPKLSNRP